MLRERRRDALPCVDQVETLPLRGLDSDGERAPEEVDVWTSLSFGKVLCRRSDAGLEDIDAASKPGEEDQRVRLVE